MDKPTGRRSSDILDAIFDKVTKAPERNAPANALFRAKALEQLDVATEVDTRLTLVSRRSWLALLGVGLLVAAFAVWAALTPSVTSLTASGRVISAPGAIEVSALLDGVVSEVATPGELVSEGGVIATVETPTGEEVLRSTVTGTVWQESVTVGQTVRVGEPIASLLPPDSGAQTLLVLPEAQAAAVRPGMTARINGTVSGEVVSLSGPMSADQAGSRTGLVFVDDTTYVLVDVKLDVPLPPGSPASGTIVLSEGTVLTRLLGRT